MANAKDVLQILKLKEQEEAPASISADSISKIKDALIKYGVSSNRSFKGWEIEKGIADDSTFLSLDVVPEGFTLSAKSGNYPLSELEAASKRLQDVVSCLNDLNSINPVLVAK